MPKYPDFVKISALAVCLTFLSAGMSNAQTIMPGEPNTADGAAPVYSPGGAYTAPALPRGGMLGLLGIPIVTINVNPMQPIAMAISSNCPLPMQMLARSWADKSEYYVTNSARLSGGSWRVVRRDRETFAVTQDYSETRINLEFDQDRLTRASCG